MKNRWIQRWFGCFIVAAVVFSSAQAEASSQSFKDVPQHHPYKEIIQDMQARGMINGYPDDTFKPNEKVSRKHVAQLLVKALKLDAKSNTDIRYKDVPKNHPYYDAISTVTQAGIFSGDINGNFNPEAPLTRVQMAKALDLAFGLTIKYVANFPDVSGNDWGYLHINALYSNGITTGNQGYFKPNEPVTRAHYAVFLHRALHLPKVPKLDSTKPLTKEGILNLVFRLPHEVEGTITTHKYKASQFSKVRAELLDRATQPYVDDELENYYADMCTSCDMILFPILLGETDYRFEILENTPNLTRIRTVSFDIPLQDAAFLEYAFEKQSGKWKLSGYDWKPVGAGSFDLTKKEALKIVKNDYERYEASSVRVTFLGSKYEYQYDRYTNQDYRRLVYRMHVDAGKENINILFYPHSGFFDRE